MKLTGRFILLCSRVLPRSNSAIISRKLRKPSKEVPPRRKQQMKVERSTLNISTLISSKILPSRLISSIYLLRALSGLSQRSCLLIWTRTSWRGIWLGKWAPVRRPRRQSVYSGSKKEPTLFAQLEPRPLMRLKASLILTGRFIWLPRAVTNPKWTNSVLRLWFNQGMVIKESGSCLKSVRQMSL